MAFTAKDVQALREKTGCGMMDCKNALKETDGNMDAAVDYLREKGLASQAKKASRVAAEGQVVALVEGGVAAVIEVNSETDFVAGNDEFKEFVNLCAKAVIANNPADVDALIASTYEGKTVGEYKEDIFLKFRENIQIRRFVRIEGKVVSYVHAGGKIGVLVNFDTELAADNEGLVAMGKNVAMQIAAMNPAYLDEASVPAEVLAKEKEILIAQMKEDPKMANKPEAVLGKIVEGKIGKYYKENCLVEQAFIKDDSKKICELLNGAGAKINRFAFFVMGEGIEKKSEDLSEEVAKQVAAMKN